MNTLPWSDNRNTHRCDSDHGHGAASLCSLNIIVVAVDGSEGGLKVVVVVIIPVVVGVDNHIAHLIE